VHLDNERISSIDGACRRSGCVTASVAGDILRETINETLRRPTTTGAYRSRGRSNRVVAVWQAGALLDLVYAIDEKLLEGGVGGDAGCSKDKGRKQSRSEHVVQGC
jgi:hypothetical protein